MAVTEEAKNALRGMRSKYADEEEAYEDNGDPQFHKPRPECARNCKRRMGNPLVRLAELFGRDSHRCCRLSGERIQSPGILVPDKIRSNGDATEP